MDTLNEIDAAFTSDERYLSNVSTQAIVAQTQIFANASLRKSTLHHRRYPIGSNRRLTVAKAVLRPSVPLGIPKRTSNYTGVEVSYVHPEIYCWLVQVLQFKEA